jgi:hypothetical protein
MVDLMAIDDVRQMLAGEFALRQRWVDSRLESLAGCKIALDQIWSPGLIFYNSGRRFANRPETTTAISPSTRNGSGSRSCPPPTMRASCS